MWLASCFRSPGKKIRPKNSPGRRTRTYKGPGKTSPTFLPQLETLENRCVPTVVGYYDMTAGAGVVAQREPITRAGHTPVSLGDLTATDLTGIEVLMVQNPNNFGYGAEFLNRLPSVWNAVNQGMTLVVHDRFVDAADTILPGGQGINFISSLVKTLDVVNFDNLVVNGPAGSVNNSTFDGWSFATHGYATLATLPAGTYRVFNNGTAGQLVTFSYPYGAGRVVYSSIPLDYWLGQSGNPFRQIYAPNVVAYAAGLVNHIPVAHDASYLTNENQTLTGLLAAGDADGNSLTFSIVNQANHGTVTVTNPATGAFTYVPSPGFFGRDSFGFRANDGRSDSNLATVIVDVLAVNHAPVAQNGGFTVNEDETLQGNLPASDPDNNILNWSIVNQPVHGTISVSNTGSFIYVPDANFHGTDAFTFRANDGALNSNLATITIGVTSVNDLPAASDASFSADEDGVIQGTLQASDLDGDALTFSVVDPALHGAVSITDPSTGAFTYVPEANFHGTDSFSFRINDGQADSTIAVVVIEVRSVNDEPVANSASLATDEDVPLNGVLTAGDADGDVLTWVLVDSPLHGTVTVGDQGGFTYYPDPNFNGLDFFTFRVSDGQVSSDLVSLIIEVRPVNDAPTADDESFTIDEDGTAQGNLTGSDIDQDALTFVLVDSPNHGTVSVDETGAYVYVPDANFFGTDSFTFRVNDGQLDSEPATVSINVTSVNDAPVALAGEAQGTDEGQQVSFDASASYDVDGDLLTFLWDFGDGNTASGQSAAHSFGDNGQYKVTLTVLDGNGGVDTDTLVVTVRNVAPGVTIAGPRQGVRGQELFFEGSFTDPGVADGWTGTVDFGDGSPVEPLGLKENGTFRFNHRYSSVATFQLTVRISDKDGGSGVGTWNVGISAVAIQESDSSGRTSLVVGGTSGSDHIHIKPAKRSGEFNVYINDEYQGTFGPTQEIVVYGQAGDDWIQVAPGIDLPACLYGDEGNDLLEGGGGADYLFGGPGNDWLWGHAGNDVLMGEADNDWLFGGQGQDLLIGGSGKDMLVGGGDGDLLIGGETAFDSDQDALAAVFAEWTSDRNLATRKNNLQGGSGALPPGQDRRNGNLFLNFDGPEATVFGSEGDVLKGNGGKDWLLPTPRKKP